jgi:hypothetical protein
MRLTLAQARKLNIDPVVIRQAKGQAREANNDGMNKTERAFAEMLGNSVHVARWMREPIKVRLAGRTWYTPDFGVWPDPGIQEYKFTLVEVKGFMRDDAAVKIKVAASLYPEWRWLLVRRAGRHGWLGREVTSRGIGTVPVQIPWILGG